MVGAPAAEASLTTACCRRSPLAVKHRARRVATSTHITRLSGHPEPAESQVRLRRGPDDGENRGPALTEPADSAPGAVLQPAAGEPLRVVSRFRGMAGLLWPAGYRARRCLTSRPPAGAMQRS